MIALSIAAILCIVVFQGNTEQLIPLYAVGVFVPFTCALLGLVICYWKTAQMIVPLLAMLLTSTVVIALIMSKWMVVWPVVIFVPIIVYGCLRIRHHYDEVAQSLTNETVFPNYNGQIMIIPISGIYQTTKKALAILELQHCSNMYALYIGHSKEDVAHMKEEWAKFAPNIRLITFVSSNQYLLKPLMRTILKIKARADKQNYHVMVAVPQLVTQKKRHAALHNHHAFALKQALLAQPGISIMNVPYSVQPNHDKG
ncbi:hypothetical protein LZ480_00855 [Solibacillus sp. MA9]|uniref:Amino acid permease n=1 Tax=Solibacillus palustris TaxID=2908203 RepID=A0ABS9U7V2_9BACL|nr:hypothetical protein [Solibacillus sp. MA9]MCH7320420.1 hypothetical protein [Solibacillus sp. MA9]